MANAADSHLLQLAIRCLVLASKSLKSISLPVFFAILFPMNFCFLVNSFAAFSYTVFPSFQTNKTARPPKLETLLSNQSSNFEKLFCA